MCTLPTSRTSGSHESPVVAEHARCTPALPAAPLMPISRTSAFMAYALTRCLSYRRFAFLISMQALLIPKQ